MRVLSWAFAGSAAVCMAFAAYLIWHGIMAALEHGPVAGFNRMTLALVAECVALCFMLAAFKTMPRD